MDVRFVIWNVTYCFSPGSLKNAAAELAKYSGQQISPFRVIKKKRIG
jgi:hypothetical protein